MTAPLTPIAGPYRPRRCQVGGTLFCELRGTVRDYWPADREAVARSAGTVRRVRRGIQLLGFVSTNAF